MPRKLLLLSPPGVGKSTLALVISQRLKRDCYFIRMPMLGNEYHNSDTSNLTRLISTILEYNKPCVIIMDEINIYAEKKSAIGADLNTASVLWLLMDRCAQNPNILIIGTCNNVIELAPQLKDRFEGNIIEIPRVNVEQRLRILRYYLSRFEDGCSSKYLNDLEKKMDDFSPRQIEALVNSAYQQSILRSSGEIITDTDFAKAYARFAASSKILYSRLANIKNWTRDNGHLIPLISGSINLAVLIGSIGYFFVKDIFSKRELGIHY